MSIIISIIERKKSVQQLQTELNSERIASAKLHAQNEAHQARIQALHTAHEDKLAAMNASEQRLHTQFENLANRIFEEKQQRYTQQTKHNIEAVLAPFKNELDGFKRQISEQHIREGQERASLKTEILSLKAPATRTAPLVSCVVICLSSILSSVAENSMVWRFL